MKFAIVEKKNHLAVHAIFDNLASAETHLLHTIPVYVQRSYFMDKTLRADDFEVIPLTFGRQRRKGNQ